LFARVLIAIRNNYGAVNFSFIKRAFFRQRPRGTTCPVKFYRGPLLKIELFISPTP
jgi:hypothetical protein